MFLWDLTHSFFCTNSFPLPKQFHWKFLYVSITFWVLWEAETRQWMKLQHSCPCEVYNQLWGQHSYWFSPNLPKAIWQEIKCLVIKAINLPHPVFAIIPIHIFGTCVYLHRDHTLPGPDFCGPLVILLLLVFFLLCPYFKYASPPAIYFLEWTVCSSSPPPFPPLLVLIVAQFI